MTFDFVYKMHSQDQEGVGHTAPCLFSTIEKAKEWAAMINPDSSYWFVEYKPVDNYYTNAMAQRVTPPEQSNSGNQEDKGKAKV